MEHMHELTNHARSEAEPLNLTMVAVGYFDIELRIAMVGDEKRYLLEVRYRAPTGSATPQTMHYDLPTADDVLDILHVAHASTSLLDAIHGHGAFSAEPRLALVSRAGSGQLARSASTPFE